MVICRSHPFVLAVSTREIKRVLANFFLAFHTSSNFTIVKLIALTFLSGSFYFGHKFHTREMGFCCE